MSFIDPIDAIVAYLEVDADVMASPAAGRVAGGELPADMSGDMPFGVILVSESGGIGDGGLLPLDHQRIDVNAYGRTMAEAKQVAIAARRALRRLNRQVFASTFLHSAVPSGGYLGAREPAPLRWPRVMRSYDLLYDEREVA